MAALKKPDYLAAEARRWLGVGRRGGYTTTPWTPAQLAVREALKAHYEDIDAVFPLTPSRRPDGDR